MNMANLPMENIKIINNRIRASKKTEEEFERLVKSIKELGLSNPIMITTDLELLDGYWRLKAFKRVHKDLPYNEDFQFIPVIMVTKKEEMEDLKIEISDGRSSDYERDTAMYRVKMIYDRRLFDKPLSTFLGINEQEIENRAKVGESLTIGVLSNDESMVKLYKQGKYSHKELFKRIETPEKISEKEELFENKPMNDLEGKFKLKKWI